MCSADTLDKNDLVAFEIHYSDRVGENYFATYSDKHRWFYYPQLTREEAILLENMA